MNIQGQYYCNELLRTKRGNSRGVFSNAKPIYLLAIIESIDEGVLLGNRILPNDDRLQSIYKTLYKELEPDKNITIFSLPYFHLNAEDYYHIKWQSGVQPPAQAKSPSQKYLNTNVCFAYLDEELWDTLQDKEIRAYYTKRIKTFFLGKE